MRDFSRWKVWGIVLLCLGLAVPASAPALARDRMSGAQGAAEANPGPAGGSQLLFEANVREISRHRSEQMEDVLRGELRRNGVAFSQMQVSNREVRFQLDTPAQLRQAEALVRNQIDLTDTHVPAWTVRVAGGRQLVMRQTEAGAADLVRRVMETTRNIIERRIEALGMSGPTVVVQGVSRILVRVPATQDAEALRPLVGRTGRLEFRLVEANSVPCGAPRRPGIQHLAADELPAGTCMGVQDRALLSDEQIADANQSRDEQDRVAVLVRFNTHGSQRFAEVTRDNVRRRVAIVLDNHVLSAPVINEPILGGVASIAGSFTVESANQLAISLRSGRLPVTLHMVEERAAASAIRPHGFKTAND